MSAYMKNYYYSNSNEPFLSKIGELSIQNHNRIEIIENNKKRANIIKSGFFREDHNSIDAITGNLKTSVSSNPKTDFYNSIKGDKDLSYTYNYSNHYNNSNNNYHINNNYGKQSQIANKNILSNSLIYGSDPIYNKLVDSNQYNNDSANDNSNEKILNSIITSKVGLNN